MKAKIFEALHICARAVCAVKSLEKVQVEGDPAKIATFRVYCSKPALAGSLLFLPLIPSPQSIGQDCVHPHKVQCCVLDDGKPMHIAPCVRVDGRQARSTKEQVEKRGVVANWVVPFWVIRRSQDKECNCTFAEIDWQVIFMAGIGGTDIESPRVVFDSSLKLPVITNTSSLEKDTELVILWVPQGES